METTLKLRLELDAVRTEHLQRPSGDPRDDLLERLWQVRRESKARRIPEFALVSLLRASDILLDGGRSAEALDALERAETELSGRDAHLREIDILSRQGRAYALRETWTEASEVCGRGIEIVEASRRKVSPLGLQSAYLRFKIQLYEIGVRAAYELGHPEEALRRAELAKCAMAQRIASGTDHGAEPDDLLRAQYRAICEQLDRECPTPEAQSQLEAKRRTLWDRLLIRRLRRSEQRPGEGDSEVSHSSLGADEGLLYYFWTAPLELMIFGITQDEVNIERRVLSEEERATADRIPEAILSFRRGCGWQLEPTSEDTALLLPASILHLLDSKSRWLVSPHRALHLLPFHALPLEGGFLIDRHPVCYVPNLHAAVARHQPREAEAMCAVAVPRTTGRDDAGRPFAAIPNAREECEQIGKTYARHGVATRTLVGPEATADAIRELDRTGELAHFSHLHLICHGATVDSNSPLESILVLSDAILDGLDVAGLRLDAELVVLSACCSGQRPVRMPSIGPSAASEELPGDEIFGLQAAFFAAGARQILATMWTVNSDPAFAITGAFHEALLEGFEPPEALQRAVIGFREKAGPWGEAVAEWAPFFLTALSRPAICQQ